MTQTQGAGLECVEFTGMTQLSVLLGALGILQEGLIPDELVLVL